MVSLTAKDYISVGRTGGMRILVTGAETKYGTAWASLLADEYDVRCFGGKAHDDIESIVGDRTAYDDVRPAMEDVDVVIDMPVAGEPNATWDAQSRTMAGTFTFLEAAEDAGVDSYIVGSSNMVVQGYEVDHAPDLYDPDYEFTIDHTAVPRPLTPYGVTRLFAEHLARMYAEAEDWQLGRHIVEGRDFPEHVYILRWGSVRTWDGFDHPYGDAEYGVEHDMWERHSDEYELAVERMKATWLSARDLKQLVSLMIEDESVTFDVFYGVSETDRGWLDIEHAKDVLGYEPKDVATEWDATPS
jgi:hypothetical protein